MRQKLLSAHFTDEYTDTRPAGLMQLLSGETRIWTWEDWLQGPCIQQLYEDKN